MARVIFISYSRKDLEKVKAIKEEIEKATDTECWMDLEGIESGAQQFTQDIVDGINGSRVFLFMLSKESQNSKFALRELNFAMKKAETNKEKHVVIVNIDNCQMCDEFYLMYGLTDTITWNDPPQKEKLIRDIKRWKDELIRLENNTKEENINRLFMTVNDKLDSEYVNSLNDIDDPVLRSRLKAQSAARKLQYEEAILKDINEDAHSTAVDQVLLSTKKAKLWVENEIKRLKDEEKRQKEESSILQQALTRYKLRKMIEARREKPSIVVCSEPQKGASQLICNFLQNKDKPSNIQTSSGNLYFPRYPISPFDGPDNGIACRFSTITGNQKLPSPIKARLLTIPKLAEWICISYYQNVADINNYSEEELSNIKSNFKKYKSLPKQQDALITEEDIAGIKDQILRNQNCRLILLEVQNLLDDIAAIACNIPKEDLANVFSCMWHFDSILTTFFKRMIIALEKLNFSKEAYLPINVLDNDIKETNNVLSYKCFSYLEKPKKDTITDVFLSTENGIATIERFSIAELSALMTEAVLFIDEEQIQNDVFKKADLIKLSSLRASSCIPQSQIAENLSNMLARGKSRLIYDDCMDSLSMNVLIFCHDQYPPLSTWSLMLQDWVNAYVGQTPSMRASMLNHTHGISPLFIVSTKFNQDIMMTNGESMNNNKDLEYRWIERFEKILFKEVLQGNRMEWVTNWTHIGEYFNNVYLLGTQEKYHLPQSCFEQLRTSFINNSIVCRFFKNPAETWDTITTKNDDGTQYIIDNLSRIIPAIERLRDEQLFNTIAQLTDSLKK